MCKRIFHPQSFHPNAPVKAWGGRWGFGSSVLPGHWKSLHTFTHKLHAPGRGDRRLHYTSQVMLLRWIVRAACRKFQIEPGYRLYNTHARRRSCFVTGVLRYRQEYQRRIHAVSFSRKNTDRGNLLYNYLVGWLASRLRCLHICSLQEYATLIVEFSSLNQPDSQRPSCCQMQILSLGPADILYGAVQHMCL